MGNNRMTMLAAPGLYVEFTTRYKESIYRKVVGKYEMGLASGPANILRTMKLLEEEVLYDCHLFAVTGPNDENRDRDPIGAQLEKELGYLFALDKSNRIELHSYRWREQMPISNNIIARDDEGNIVYEHGIRCKPGYELDKDKEAEILGDLQKVIDSASGKPWIILASVASEDIELVTSILEEVQNKANVVVILSGEAIKDERVSKKRDHIISRADYLIQNEEETKALLGDGSPWDWVEQLSDMGSGNVIVTLAEGGAVARHGSDGIFFQSAFRVKPVDATGAGDTFVGGFLHGLCSGKSFQESLRYGAAAAAVQVTVLGGRPQVTLEKIDALFRGH